MSLMIADYHMHLEEDGHTAPCPYTVSRVRLYVAQAQKRGADEIGVSEHCNRFEAFLPVMSHLLEGDEEDPGRRWLESSFREDLASYVDTLLGAKREGLPVRASIEVDYLPGREKEIADILSPYPFDYIIGSVHFLGQWLIDIDPQSGWPEADVDQVYTEYFETLKQAARSGLFDTLAHPDLVKKFGHRPSFPPDELYDEIARVAKEADVAVEISSAGLRKPVKELYPAKGLIRRFFDRGVPITFGSDAHRPDDVGLDLDVAVQAATEAGYRTLSLFEKRRRRQVSIA